MIHESGTRLMKGVRWTYERRSERVKEGTLTRTFCGYGRYMGLKLMLVYSDFIGEKNHKPGFVIKRHNILSTMKM